MLGVHTLHRFNMLHVSLSAGFVAPFIFGDGGRAKEEASTTYAYRIKQLYPSEK